jgi:putative endonuclease
VNNIIYQSAFFNVILKGKIAMAKEKKTRRKDLGDWGETYASNYLEGLGYEVLNRNVRTPYGEIDIVAKEKNQLVFIEVKTRSSKKYGNPEDSITEAKILHLIESAESYLQDNPEYSEDWRVDVIAIQVDPQKNSPSLTHFENALK